MRTQVSTQEVTEAPNKKRSAVLLALAGILVALVALATVGVDRAQAAFPGANGKIVFVSERTTGTGVDNPTGDPEIFTMNKDGTGLTQITNNTEDDYEPSLTADGKWLVFTSRRDGNYEIYFTDSNGAGTQFRITNNTVADHNPTTLDGNQIAYESYRNGNYDIYVQEAAGEKNLTNNAAREQSPVFSPDGTKIAFERDRDGNSEVYVMDSDGTDPKNLSKTPAYDGLPDWSPDGQRIAFRSDRNGNPDIYVMNALDGSSQKRITKKSAADLSPVWSPDGTKIAFTSFRGGGDAEIYTMKAKPEGETNRPKNLTNNDVVYDEQPDWQPLVN